MEIQRDFYLNKLIERKHNGLVKVITGIRRCGKSYLLFNIFKKHLLSEGISSDHIIEMSFDSYENLKYQNPELLYPYIMSLIKDDKEYYILFDEVQLLKDFEAVLNSLLRNPNIVVYVTGSNAKFLSKDIITEFRGRGDEIHIWSLSFSEFMSVYDGNKYNCWKEYVTFGGLPPVVLMKGDERKSELLKSLLKETYINDIIGRHSIKNKAEFEDLFDFLASSIGALTNPKKIAATFKSVKNVKISDKTIASYLEYLEDSFLVSSAKRYDIKGRKYIGSPLKYYYSDLGLRNARINFRQLEESHLMENIIYNELLRRGYNVDVGVVESFRKDEKNGTRNRIKLEVDFVCNLASKRLYIQSALALPDKEKLEQESNSLINIPDAFKKIIIVKDVPRSYYTDSGILILDLFDFLLGNDSLKSIS